MRILSASLAGRFATRRAIRIPESQHNGLEKWPAERLQEIIEIFGFFGHLTATKALTSKVSRA